MVAEGTGGPQNQLAYWGSSWTLRHSDLFRPDLNTIITSASLGSPQHLLLKGCSFSRLRVWDSGELPHLCSRLQFALHKCCGPIGVSAPTSFCPWSGHSLCCGSSPPLVPLQRPGLFTGSSWRPVGLSEFHPHHRRAGGQLG